MRYKEPASRQKTNQSKRTEITLRCSHNRPNFTHRRNAWYGPRRSCRV